MPIRSSNICWKPKNSNNNNNNNNKNTFCLSQFAYTLAQRHRQPIETEHSLHMQTCGNSWSTSSRNRRIPTSASCILQLLFCRSTSTSFFLGCFSLIRRRIVVVNRKHTSALVRESIEYTQWIIKQLLGGKTSNTHDSLFAVKIKEAAISLFIYFWIFEFQVASKPKIETGIPLSFRSVFSLSLSLCLLFTFSSLFFVFH